MSTYIIRPNGDSSPLTLTCSSGSSHYSLVNETSADDDNYLYHFGDNQSPDTRQDVYTFQNPVADYGPINSITIAIRVWSTADHLGTISPTMVLDGTFVEGLGGEFTHAAKEEHRFTFENKPVSGDPWTYNDIQNILAGVETWAYVGTYCYVSQVYVEVDYTPYPTPTIDSFSATPENMEFGKSSLLAWETTDATTVTLNQNIGLVGVDGAKSVSPSETTSYTLSASNISGTVYDYVTVTVIPSSNKISMADIAGSFPNRGLLPQLGIGKSYLEYSSDITDTYVQSLGFSFTGGDFKRPYMAKDYQSMMYLFNDTPSDISNGVRETQLSKITGSLPDRNDAYFDFSQTLASADNFNAYAAENYRLMGKVLPKASMSFVGAVESIFSDVDTNIPSRNTANLSVVSPRFSGDKYIWTGRVKDGTGDWGSLSNSSGLTTTYYTPTLTANQRNVIITLSSGGKTLAELEFMVWFKG